MKSFLKSLAVTMMSCLAVMGFSRAVFSQFDFAEPGKHYLELTYDYHEEMNEFFNGKFEGLVEVIEDKNFLKDEKLQAKIRVPASIDEAADGFDEVLLKCKAEENFSTYCVSMEATEFYVTYLLAIEDNEVALLIDNLGSNQEQLEAMSERTDFFDEEKLKAEVAMKRALAVYNEFSLAYPMHIRYEEVLKNLILYRQTVKDVRLETDWFPLKFVDSTSAHCE